MSLWETLMGSSSCSASTLSEATYTMRQGQGSAFLKAHRPDRTMRNILDPHQVANVLQYQAEEIMRQTMDDASVVSSGSCPSQRNEKWEVESAILGTEVSVSGRSDMTNFSASTNVMSNRDRYASSKKRQKPRMDSFNPLEGIQEKTGDTHGIRRSRGSLNDLSSRAVRLHSSRKRKNPRIPQSANDPRIPEATENGCSPGISFWPSCSQPIVSQPTSVLSLKMNAGMIDFYRNEFLKTFPTASIPADMIHPYRSNSLAPGLMRSCSSSSKSSTERAPTLHTDVDYGMDIDCYPILLQVDNSPFLDMALTGSLGLADRFIPTCPDPSPRTTTKKYKVLLNRRSGVPLAVCALKSPYGPPVVRIYAIRQRVHGQRPAANTATLGFKGVDAYPLYTWAEFTAEGEFPAAVDYALYMCTGNDGRFEEKPSYTARHRVTGSPEILVSGRTESELEYQGCAQLSIQSDEDDSHYMTLALARGIDPALMLCFASIVDETMESTMRLKCDVSRRAPKGRWR